MPISGKPEIGAALLTMRGDIIGAALDDRDKPGDHK
jgi:hypothetical protein